jgi:hypothetical protein
MMVDVDTPGSVTVWMVHLRRGEVEREYKGSIALEEEALVFSDPRQGRELRFAYLSIRRAKRLRTSPVLVVDWLDEGERRRTAFYFTQPPPLYPAAREAQTQDAAPSPSLLGPFKRTGKHKAQRTNARYLQTYGIGKKDEIQAWADAVRVKVTAAR